MAKKGYLKFFYKIEKSNWKPSEC